MRVAFVVQRYGLEVVGGAETHCRQVVERMSSEYDIEVLTTCAEDYVSWENVYSPGVQNINGVPVRRFPVLGTRDSQFGTHTRKLISKPHTLQDEIEWLKAQGPNVPTLLQYIAEHHFEYDAFVFYTYIYLPTALGLRLAADRALLVPTAHDEQPLYLNVYKSLFHSARAILYNTVEEKQLLEEVFQIEYIPGEVVGLGIEIPEKTDPDRFRNTHNIRDPYVLYVGRISHSKRIHTLINYFRQFKKSHSNPLKLVLIGNTEFSIPKHQDIISLGFVSDETKFDAMAGATAFLLPSEFESLSMVFLESLAVGTPVVSNSHSEVLLGHCQRSNAGLYYSNYDEFAASLKLLLANSKLRYAMGENGKKYVKMNYSWESVIGKYKHYLDMITKTSWF